MTVVPVDPRPIRVDRQDLTVLAIDECMRLLRASPMGRLAFVDEDATVHVLPVNHHVDGFDVYFRSAPGSKLEAARSSASAAFEVDGIDEIRKLGWSVVVRGKVEMATEVEIGHLRGVGLRPWASGTMRPHWLVVRAHEVTGRSIRRPAGPAGPAEPTHRAIVRVRDGEAHLECGCGWSSRTGQARDPLARALMRADWVDHVTAIDS